MKDSSDSTAVGRAREPEEFANRKLIRPPVNREQRGAEATAERRERAPGSHSRKAVNPEQTHAENFYYQKQMQSRTPMVVVLQNGESICGIIEWYDKSCLKFNGDTQGHMLIYKAGIKYMFKQGE